MSENVPPDWQICTRSLSFARYWLIFITISVRKKLLYKVAGVHIAGQNLYTVFALVAPQQGERLTCNRAR